MYLESLMPGFYDELTKIADEHEQPTPPQPVDEYKDRARRFRQSGALVGSLLGGGRGATFGYSLGGPAQAVASGAAGALGGALLGGGIGHLAHWAQHGSKKKTAHDLMQSERTDFAQPKKEEEGHKGKYPIPDRKHYAIALGFAKMHHDEGALKAIHAKGKKMGYTKEAGGFGEPNITDGDEMAKMGGLFKNTVLGLGMLGATAGGAKAVKTIAKPAAQVAKAPRLVGAASSQMADLAREGIKFG